MTSWLMFLGVGVLAGILSGMFGIGGGLVIVPLLILVFKYSQHAASGTSLVALLLPVGLLGVMQYYRVGKIGPEQVRAGLIMAAGLFIGVYLGSRVAVGMSEVLLRRAFAVMLALSAVKLWLHR